MSALVTCLLAAGATYNAPVQRILPYPARTQAQAQPAPAWSALFNRSNGWTGADGIYSIPLTGIDAPGAVTTTLFVFSDTFIGRVGTDGARLPGSTLINNSLAILNDSIPDPAAIRFRWPGAASPTAVFVPATPAAAPGDWYWLADGIAAGAHVQLIALRMRADGGGAFGFQTAGVALITLDLLAPQPLADAMQTDLPLYLRGADGQSEDLYGGAIMANTASAGAPVPDGHVYVYGYRNRLSNGNKRALSARVPAGSFGDQSAWTFWDGSGWSADSAAAATLEQTQGLSAEFSVTPLADGRYALVFQNYGIFPETMLSIGATPVGPFTAPQVVYECPEVALYTEVFCYNAKAHLHLSRPGELLVSYNVNSFSFAELLLFADIYRPRFIRVPLPR